MCCVRALSRAFVGEGVHRARVGEESYTPKPVTAVSAESRVHTAIHGPPRGMAHTQPIAKSVNDILLHCTVINIPTVRICLTALQCVYNSASITGHVAYVRVTVGERLPALP